jgi:3-oxoacyl-[acyl-carrier-protein] synthase-1
LENTRQKHFVEQAAITGMGIVSCLGSTLDDVSAALRGGRSGIVLDEERIALGFRSGLRGRIPQLSSELLSRKMHRTMCEPAQYAYAAATDAIADAELDEENIRSGRCGLVFGNDSCMKPAVEAIDIVRDSGETHFIGGGYIFRTMNSTVSMNLAAILGIRGANWTLSAACASGAHAIGQALMLIRAGLQDIVIVGGAQETNWQALASFDALGAFSTRHDDPKAASRPFDADRDGLIPSGGAACLIIESVSHAVKRRARIQGIVRGYGFVSDGGGHLSSPTDDGAARCMRAALQDAMLTPNEIDYVNAHATSTPVGDRVEAAAIVDVFGADVPVSSTKSMTGHECWMAGASEAIYTSLMAREDFIAPNLNFSRHNDGDLRINVVKETIEAPIRLAISNSFGFGGTNASIVLDYGSYTEHRNRGTQI